MNNETKMHMQKLESDLFALWIILDSPPHEGRHAEAQAAFRVARLTFGRLVDALGDASEPVPASIEAQGVAPAKLENIAVKLSQVESPDIWSYRWVAVASPKPQGTKIVAHDVSRHSLDNGNTEPEPIGSSVREALDRVIERIVGARKLNIPKPQRRFEMDDMEKLLQEAEQRSLWLYCRHAGVWFSPRDLRERQARGHFRWGPANWELRDPKEHLEQLEENVCKAEADLAHFRCQLKTP